MIAPIFDIFQFFEIEAVEWFIGRLTISDVLYRTAIGGKLQLVVSTREKSVI